MLPLPPQPPHPDSARPDAAQPARPLGQSPAASALRRLLTTALPPHLARPLGLGLPEPVRCCHCAARVHPPARVVTCACPNCLRQITVRDLVIASGTYPGALMTCRRLLIGPRGRASANLAVASEGADIAGRLDAMLLSGGPVFIRSTATLAGGVRAPSITIEPGARLSGGPFQTPIDPIGRTDLLDAARHRPGHGPAAGPAARSEYEAKLASARVRLAHADAADVRRVTRR